MKQWFNISLATVFFLLFNSFGITAERQDTEALKAKLIGNWVTEKDYKLLTAKTFDRKVMESVLYSFHKDGTYDEDLKIQMTGGFLPEGKWKINQIYNFDKDKYEDYAEVHIDLHSSYTSPEPFSAGSEKWIVYFKGKNKMIVYFAGFDAKTKKYKTYKKTFIRYDKDFHE